MFKALKFPSYFAGWASCPVFLVDTDILSNICKGGPCQIVEKELLKRKAILLFSLPSIMELGFGPSHLTSKKEVEFYRELYDRKSSINKDIFVTEFRLTLITGDNKSLKGNWVGVSPDSHNWYFAKQSLISYMNYSKSQIENAKKLQMDMLISCSAWNARAFVWTNNIKDHLLANYFMHYSEYTRDRKINRNEALMRLAKKMIPVFNTRMLEMILSGESFNVYTEMKKKTQNTDIINVLEIAESLIT